MTLTRRAFLASSAAGLAAPKYQPEIAAQFYVWTQHFAREKKPLADGIPEAFAATRRAGYRQMELVSWIFTPTLREKTLASLEENGLTAPIVYSGAKLHEDAESSIKAVLELAEVVRPAGCRMMNVNPNPKANQAKTGAELDVQAANVRRLDAELRKRGIGLMLHHHAPEMADGAREWRHLLRNTETPFCMDTHWVLRGGQNPLALVKEAGPRVAAVHLRNSVKGIWTESLGDGDIDYGRSPLTSNVRALRATCLWSLLTSRGRNLHVRWKRV
jgi:sugar phosphate isomerase/epimerase